MRIGVVEFAFRYREWSRIKYKAWEEALKFDQMFVLIRPVASGDRSAEIRNGKAWDRIRSDFSRGAAFEQVSDFELKKDRRAGKFDIDVETELRLFEEAGKFGGFGRATGT